MYILCRSQPFTVARDVLLNRQKHLFDVHMSQTPACAFRKKEGESERGGGRGGEKEERMGQGGGAG